MKNWIFKTDRPGLFIKGRQCQIGSRKCQIIPKWNSIGMLRTPNQSIKLCNAAFAGILPQMLTSSSFGFSDLKQWWGWWCGLIYKSQYRSCLSDMSTVCGTSPIELNFLNAWLLISIKHCQRQDGPKALSTLTLSTTLDVTKLTNPTFFSNSKRAKTYWLTDLQSKAMIWFWFDENYDLAPVLFCI